MPFHRRLTIPLVFSQKGRYFPLIAQLGVLQQEAQVKPLHFILDFKINFIHCRTFSSLASFKQGIQDHYFLSLHPPLPIFQSLRFRGKWRLAHKYRPDDFDWGGPEDTAFNWVEKKIGLLKPKHTVDEQIAYMNSNTFANTYQGLPIFMWYKRNHRGQWKTQPQPRLFCIDTNGRFNLNHACPVCRDEYLFFDYRNPKLLEHFLEDGTTNPLPILKTGLCREQYVMLQAQLLKAKEHGFIEFAVPFRTYDYGEWFGPATMDKQTQADKPLKTKNIGADDGLAPTPPTKTTINEDCWRLALKEWFTEDGNENDWNAPIQNPGDITDEIEIDKIYPNPMHFFETFNADRFTKFDEWWLRHAKIAKLGCLPFDPMLHSVRPIRQKKLNRRDGFVVQWHKKKKKRHH